MSLQTRLLVGHVLYRLRELPDASVHCCVTSPPYFGLRDYGTEPQVWGGDPGCEHEWVDATIHDKRHARPIDYPEICSNEKQSTNLGSHQRGVKPSDFCRCGAWHGHLGLESTPDLYVEHLVDIFREMRRVLRDDGTFWLNIGDSYSGSTGTIRQSNLKPKDLIGIPWLLAFALRADGWYLRSEITWCKKVPMPESVTDRPTSATEKLFLFSKNQKYFYDAEAVKENSVTNDPRRPYTSPGAKALDGRDLWHSGELCDDDDFSKRNYWILGPAPNKFAHFATFPPELPRRAIQAGTSERGVCTKCGTGWRRVVEKTTEFRGGSGVAGRSSDEINASGKWAAIQYGENIKLGPVNSTKTVDWRPTCDCDAGEPTPATVLDPFFGSGTTGVVAQQLWRSCIGIDLSDEYAQIGKERMPDGLLYTMEISK